MAVKVGDQFQDLDRRNVSPRVVQVVYVRLGLSFKALVQNVEHWNEKLVGRQTAISLNRLENPSKFRKVSR